MVQSNLIIQADSNNLPYFFDAACALYGAIDLGWKYRLQDSQTE
jgi:hypothetical protein